MRITGRSARRIYGRFISRPAFRKSDRHHDCPMRVRTVFCLVSHRATSRLPSEAGVEGAKEHAVVVHRSVSMQLEKVAAIVGRQNTAFGNYECENVSVPYGRVCSSGVRRGELPARSGVSRLLQQPDRNSSPNDTGFAAAYVWSRVDSRKCFGQSVNHPFRDLRLFAGQKHG